MHSQIKKGSSRPDGTKPPFLRNAINTAIDMAPGIRKNNLMSKQVLVFEIKGNSLDDGPGIRSVIFFKGCPLSCVWCHNPESKKAQAELSFDAKECVVCNTCIENCPENALSRQNPDFIDREQCTLCFACVDACPSGALSRVGRQICVSEIVEKVVRDKPFYDTSGGGVTLSGGEPCMHQTFISKLLKNLKARNIHTLLETCGYFAMEDFRRLVMPYIDMVYFDIKIYDSDQHKRYCGVNNQLILNNFEQLLRLSRTERFLLLPRIPLIPDITDTEANLDSIARYLQSLEVKQAELLPYNPLWIEKSSKLGKHNSNGIDEAMNSWLSREKLQQCEKIFKTLGISV